MSVESAPSNEVSYLAPPTTGPAQMVSPAPGSTFTSSSVTLIDIDDSLRLLAFPPRSLRER
jgi:hypothetical protein